MAALAQWERRVIGERTTVGLAAAKEKGSLPGRRRQLPSETRQRMVELRESGLSLRKVADALNREGLPTVSVPPAAHRHTSCSGPHKTSSQKV